MTSKTGRISRTSRIERTRRVERPSIPTPFEELRALARRGSLRAVLESVDAPPVPRKAEELGEERAISLLKGLPEERNCALAPYLFAVDEEVLGWIRGTLWSGASWGILLESTRSPEDLARHFRPWVVVEDPNGDEMYFRFYDALVLRTYLATATYAETVDFFGPVTTVFGTFAEASGEEPVTRAFRKPWREPEGAGP